MAEDEEAELRPIRVGQATQVALFGLTAREHRHRRTKWIRKVGGEQTERAYSSQRGVSASSLETSDFRWSNGREGEGEGEGEREREHEHEHEHEEAKVARECCGHLAGRPPQCDFKSGKQFEKMTSKVEPPRCCTERHNLEVGHFVQSTTWRATTAKGRAAKSLARTSDGRMTSRPSAIWLVILARPGREVIVIGSREKLERAAGRDSTRVMDKKRRRRRRRRRRRGRGRGFALAQLSQRGIRFAWPAATSSRLERVSRHDRARLCDSSRELNHFTIQEAGARHVDHSSLANVHLTHNNEQDVTLEDEEERVRDKASRQSAPMAAALAIGSPERHVAQRDISARPVEGDKKMDLIETATSTTAKTTTTTTTRGRAVGRRKQDERALEEAEETSSRREKHISCSSQAQRKQVKDVHLTSGHLFSHPRPDLSSVAVETRPRRTLATTSRQLRGPTLYSSALSCSAPSSLSLWSALEAWPAQTHHQRQRQQQQQQQHQVAELQPEDDCTLSRNDNDFARQTAETAIRWRRARRKGLRPALRAQEQGAQANCDLDGQLDDNHRAKGAREEEKREKKHSNWRRPTRLAVDLALLLLLVGLLLGGGAVKSRCSMALASAHETRPVGTQSAPLANLDGHDKHHGTRRSWSGPAPPRPLSGLGLARGQEWELVKQKIGSKQDGTMLLAHAGAGPLGPLGGGPLELSPLSEAKSMSKLVNGGDNDDKQQQLPLLSSHSAPANCAVKMGGCSMAPDNEPVDYFDGHAPPRKGLVPPDGEAQNVQRALLATRLRVRPTMAAGHSDGSFGAQVAPVGSPSWVSVSLKRPQMNSLVAAKEQVNNGRQRRRLANETKRRQRRQIDGVGVGSQDTGQSFFLCLVQASPLRGAPGDSDTGRQRPLISGGSNGRLRWVQYCSVEWDRTTTRQTGDEWAEPRPVVVCCRRPHDDDDDDDDATQGRQVGALSAGHADQDQEAEDTRSNGLLHAKHQLSHNDNPEIVDRRHRPILNRDIGQLDSTFAARVHHLEVKELGPPKAILKDRISSIDQENDQSILQSGRNRANNSSRQTKGLFGRAILNTADGNFPTRDIESSTPLAEVYLITQINGGYYKSTSDKNSVIQAQGNLIGRIAKTNNNNNLTTQQLSNGRSAESLLPLQQPPSHHPSTLREAPALDSLRQAKIEASSSKSLRPRSTPPLGRPHHHQQDQLTSTNLAPLINLADQSTTSYSSILTSLSSPSLTKYISHTYDNRDQEQVIIVQQPTTSPDNRPTAIHHIATSEHDSINITSVIVDYFRDMIDKGQSLVLVLSLIILVTFAGNVLVCLSVIKVRKLRHPSNYLLISLAISDLCVACAVMPFGLYLSIHDKWELGTALCNVYVVSDVTSCTASILNLCVISIDRYLAITRPLTYCTKRTTRLMMFLIGLVWILACLISVPPLLIHGNEHGTPEDPKCEVNQGLYYQLYATCISFYIPLIVMICLYYNIYTAAKKVIEAEQRAITGLQVAPQLPPQIPPPATMKLNLNSSGAVVKAYDGNNIQLNNPVVSDRTPSSSMMSTTQVTKTSSVMRERKASITLGVIMSAFTICWLPFFILALLRPFSSYVNNLPRAIVLLTLWLGYANSLLNPIIYVTFHHDFRNAFKHLLCLRCMTINEHIRKDEYKSQYGDTHYQENKRKLCSQQLPNHHQQQQLLSKKFNQL